ncbi:MAG: hypothetical protein P4M14_08475 [Gammaproteobacteria bacterium]|nr:hypothetical protein [Gammaproteobacteria bacterium]
MASQSWAEFFEETRRFIKSDPVKSRFTWGETFRGFLLKHFTHAVNTQEGGQSLLEHTRREIYVTEGNFAYQQSQLMQKTIERSVGLLIEPGQHMGRQKDAEVLGQKMLSNLLDYLEKLPNAIFVFSPGSGKTIRKIKKDVRWDQAERNSRASRESAIKKLFIRTTVRNYLVEKIIADRIDAEFSEPYARFKETRSSEALTSLLNAIEEKYPLIAWDGADSDLVNRPLRKAVEELLKRKLGWELANPLGVYVHRYIPADSDFFNRIIISPLFLTRLVATDMHRHARRSVAALAPSVHHESNLLTLPSALEATEAKVNENLKRSFTHALGFDQDKEHEVPQGMQRRASIAPYRGAERRAGMKLDVSLAHLAEFPTLRNMIGFNLLNPFYMLDAIGQIVFGNLAKVLCYSIDRSLQFFGFNTHSKSALAIKITVAGILTLAIPLRFLTFSMAKISDKVSKWVGHWLCPASQAPNIALIDYPASLGSPNQSNAQSALPSPRHATAYQSPPVVQPQTHAFVQRQIQQAQRYGVSASVSSPSPMLDASVGSISLRPVPDHSGEVESSPEKNVSRLVLSEEKNHHLAPRYLGEEALEPREVVSTVVQHSRSRNRFTFAFHQEESPLSVISPLPGLRSFEAPVLAIHRPTPQHVPTGSIWEGDFPGAIIVSNCIVPEEDSSLETPGFAFKN